MQSKILAKGPFLLGQIEVRFNENSNLKSESWIHDVIEQTWENLQQQVKEKNQVLWHGQSLRLESFVIENGRLILIVSTIMFRQRICLERNIDKVESLGGSYFSQGIAVGGLIKTTDNYFIFAERSGKTVAQSPIDLIGGVLEDLHVKNGNDLFNFNLKELEEEINLIPENVLNSSFLGLIQGVKGNVILVSLINLNIDSAQVKARFDSLHDDEMSAIIFVPEPELHDYLVNLGSYKPSIAKLY